MFNKDEAQGAQADNARQEEIRPIIPEIKSLETPFMGSAGALVLVATILVIVGTGILYLFKYSRQNLLAEKDKQYTQINKELYSGELGKFQSSLSEVVNGQKSLENVLNSRIYWSRYWSKLQCWTPKAVDYSSMAIDESGTVTISGETSDYKALAKLMVSLQKVELFKNVEVGGFSQSTIKNRLITNFNLRMNVNTALLTKSSPVSKTCK